MKITAFDTCLDLVHNDLRTEWRHLEIPRRLNGSSVKSTVRACSLATGPFHAKP